MTAFTIELKLSSRRMIDAASLATSVPAIPIAKPTSDFLRAGASLVPSPVTATTSPLQLSPVTRVYLSWGLDLARTSRLATILLNSALFAMVSTRWGLYSFFAETGSFGHSQTAVQHFAQISPPTAATKSDPSMTIEFGFPAQIMPISLAMAFAVIMLSPVTIRTFIPADLQSFIALGTYGLGTSRTPRMQIRVRSCFSTLKTPKLSLVSVSVRGVMTLQATTRVLKAFQAMSFMLFSIFLKRALSMGYTLSLFLLCQLLQHFSTIQEAPLQYKQLVPSTGRTTLILFLEDEKGSLMVEGYLSLISSQLTPARLMNLRRAISVLEPFSTGRRLALELQQVESTKCFLNPYEKCVPRLISELMLLKSQVQMFQIAVRFIWFIVRVPVLSEHMLFAPPMVSQAYIFRTRLLSFNIRVTEQASERVTLKGSPSGMATTTTVTERMKQCTISIQRQVVHQLARMHQIASLIIMMINMSTAEISPNLPISVAMCYSFICKGVALGSSWRRTALILPMQEESPTTITIILPQPFRILVPERSTQDGTQCLPLVFLSPFSMIEFLFYKQFWQLFLWIGSVQPVIADQSLTSQEAQRTKPSDGIYIPSCKYMMSPTRTLSWCRFVFFPLRITVTYFLESATEFSL